MITDKEIEAAIDPLWVRDAGRAEMNEAIANVRALIERATKEAVDGEQALASCGPR